MSSGPGSSSARPDAAAGGRGVASRQYQQLDIAAGKEAGLAAEYDALLRKNPTTPLLYLRGRVDAEPAKGQEFFHRACKADAACPWPWMACLQRGPCGN